MISIIGAIVLGVAFTLVASQNPAVVPVDLLIATLSLPLYIVAAAAFLIGIFVTLLFTLFDTTSAVLESSNKDSKIRQFEKANLNLQNHINNMRVENARLKDELRLARGQARGEKIAATKQNIKNFFSRLRHNLSI